MDNESDIVGLLSEIRDQQRTQLERQAEAMALQREQFEMARRQFERAERLQERAEQLQVRSAAVAAASRKALWILLPVIIIAVLYLSFLLFIHRG